LAIEDKEKTYQLISEVFEDIKKHPTLLKEWGAYI
jgi:hypothetical protein